MKISGQLASALIEDFRQKHPAEYKAVTTMSRERLEGILRQELPVPQMRERGIAEIMAVFDRLTRELKDANELVAMFEGQATLQVTKAIVLRASIAQLLEALKTDVIELANLATLVDQQQTSQYMESVYAAIRAVEEAK